MSITGFNLVGILAILTAVLLLYYVLRKNGIREFSKYLVAGLAIALIDFVIESIGTSVGHWTYHDSLHLISGRIPVELIFLFFAGGVVGRFVYVKSTNFPKPVRLNTIFYILILTMFLVYLHGIFVLQINATITYIASLFGLWGFANITKEENRISAIVLAASVAFTDFVIEGFFLGKGTYLYSGFTGLPWHIPLVYGFLTLGALGFMEKLDIIDKFYDHPIARSLLHLLGIRRERYRQKMRTVVKIAKEKATATRKKVSKTINEVKNEIR